MGNLIIKPKYHLITFVLILLGCIFLLVGRLYTTGSAIGGDAVYYYAALRSVAKDYNLDFKNEYEYFYSQVSNFTKNRKLPEIPSKDPYTGKLPTKYPIGNVIFLLPTYLLTDYLLIALQQLGANITTDGYSMTYQVASALTNLLYAFLGILLIYNLGRKIFNSQIAFFGTFSIWLATPLIYYMTMEPLNSQSLSFFLVSFFIYLWFIIRTSQKKYLWIILGLVGGLMSIVRYQDVLFMLIPIIDGLFFKKIGNILLLLLFAGLAIIPQLWVNHYLFGSPFTTGYAGIGFPYLTAPKIFYSLFSLERGLLVWSPILFFALIGLYWFFKKTKLIGSLLIISFLVQLYIISSWADPSQGDSFGNRMLLNSNLIFALGIMQFLKNTQTYQKLFLGIFALLIFLNGVLAYLFIFRIIGQPY